MTNNTTTTETRSSDPMDIAVATGRAHALWLYLYLCQRMDVSGLSRSYAPAEYTRDEEWRELTGEHFDCVVIHSRNDNPAMVTIDGRSWQVDVTVGAFGVVMQATPGVPRPVATILGNRIGDELALAGQAA